MWQELASPFKKVLRMSDHVVAQVAEERDLFTGVYKLKNVSFIPFDVGLPAVKKEQAVDGRRIRVLLPWFDRNARCTQAEFLSGLEYIIERMPELHLTVAISSSKFAPGVAKFFRRLSRQTARVDVVRGVEINARQSLFINHDLTLFPAECDNFGFCNLLSIACGTPVLTFAVSPQLDFVYQDVNGVVVKTQVDYDEHGVPHANPDYNRYIKCLQTLIAEPWHINTMNKKINYNLTARRRAFELGWQAILRLV
jgi:glycosyltransferase involved in cell wall biosynthesis